EQLNPSVVRASYSDLELHYSTNTRCLLSHAAAWSQATAHDGYTLICEADFVPCREFGSLPVFWPTREPLSWGYLYYASPRLLALTGAHNDLLRAHATSTVCYVINAPVARVFCEFFEYEMSRLDPKSYFTFDAHLQWWTMGQGATAFIPWRQYGEHGGFINPEHQLNSIQRSGWHRADRLIAGLHFLPAYAM